MLPLPPPFEKRKPDSRPNQSSHPIGEIFHLVRFGNKLIRLHRRIRKNMLIYSAADQNHFLLRIHTPTLANQIHPAHPTHGIVGYDHHRLLVWKFFQGQLRITKSPHFKTKGAQDRLRQIQQHWFIIHNKNCGLTCRFSFVLKTHVRGSCIQNADALKLPSNPICGK